MTDIEKQVCNETIFTKSCKPGRDFLHTCKSWLSFTDFDLQWYSLGGLDTSSGWLGEKLGEDWDSPCGTEEDKNHTGWVLLHDSS